MPQGQSLNALAGEADQNAPIELCQDIGSAPIKWHPLHFR